MSDLLNILSNSNKDIDNQKLMDYLSGKLSGKEKHDVEVWIAENDFTNDAVEGLQEIREPSAIPGYVEQLNLDLKKFIAAKKERRESRRIRNNPWTYLAVILIIALIILAYIVIRKLQ